MNQCQECVRLNWPKNNQPLYAVNGKSLCWSHAQLEKKREADMVAPSFDRLIERLRLHCQNNP